MPESTTGYRYCIGANGEIYIIKLLSTNEQPDEPNPHFFCSEDCTCLSITNANTGNEIETLFASAERKHCIEYKKGAKIHGKCWYVHSYEDLFKPQINCADSLLSRAHDGTIYKGFILYRKLDEFIADACQSSLEEVAAEMSITIDELHQIIDFLKKGQVNEQEIGAPIIKAGNAVYSKKIKSGEIEPGWKKNLRNQRITGYRYARDNRGRYWIVKISTTKEEPARHNVQGYENEWVSDDCTCEAIIDMETGQEVKELELSGCRGNKINYKVGQKIGHGLCWYCHTLEDLCKNYLSRDRNGKLYEPFMLAKKMNSLITQTYNRTYEEVANKMHITPAELRENVEMLRIGLGEMEDETLYMPILEALESLGKLPAQK